MITLEEADTEPMPMPDANAREALYDTVVELLSDGAWAWYDGESVITLHRRSGSRMWEYEINTLEQRLRLLDHAQSTFKKGTPWHNL